MVRSYQTVLEASLKPGNEIRALTLRAASATEVVVDCLKLVYMSLALL